ncbi:histidine phosphatase family protein [Mucilaginibacter robiniae]|uniref:Histidine phosphatase family protein n=1 Tax=Mucilaginibacter robiniae TaxID=2728022 RepID=A0A7L5E0R8_9SPHI|nr:histidine phosphatase family protein [Mucilaginibacter robiniae]QJD96825.1 histidine phosphatase family protein [Mucilaginibacter robiniae]
MTKFVLIRHATTNSVGYRLSGRTPGISLNEEGKAQAQTLAERLTHLPLSAIYSSPLERAVETAEPIAASHQLTSTICEDFLEIDFGQWTNKTFKELESELTFKLFNSFRSYTRIPGGETMTEAQLRIINGFEKLRSQHEQETIAIVSHVDLIKAAITYYAGIPLDLFQRIEISPASVSIIELYEETARITLLNHTGDIKG